MDELERHSRFADDQQAVFRLGMNAYNASLLRFWTESGMLPHGARVIDIGCGVGKYGTYLAELGCDVTLTDISEEMLIRAKDNMAPYKTPWQVFQCDFHEATGNEPVFAGGFDLAISTMSPAICDVETVRKMSAMTHGWCFLARFYEFRQPLRKQILSEVHEEAMPLHGNTQGDCASMIRCIKEAGYTPLITYTDYDWADRRTPDQMSRYLLDRCFPCAEDPSAIYEELLHITRSFAEADGML
ncbi:MAG: methyltransferase domain-containing protein, partial [Clostridia bacterium]|nr:methyltransferase domain-containing protein [Clostridia bacterium]